MNYGYFIAAIVLFAASYALAFIGNFVRFPVAMIVTTLGSMALKIVSVILLVVGIYKAVKGSKKKSKKSKFTNAEEDDDDEEDEDEKENFAEEDDDEEYEDE